MFAFSSLRRGRRGAGCRSIRLSNIRRSDMTIEAERASKPALIVPKKRLGGKKPGSTAGYVDHIITVQGSSNTVSEMRSPFIDVEPRPQYDGPVGLVDTKWSGSNRNRALNSLPMIPDDDENCEPSPSYRDKQFKTQPIEACQVPYENGHDSLSKNDDTNEIVTLSPIYENLSSHDDERNSIDDIVASKNGTSFADDSNDSDHCTPNDLSQAHSEASLETGSSIDRQFLKHGAKKKKKVNIVSLENETEQETSTYESVESSSPERRTTARYGDGYLTMNGTIKRGKKKGQNVDVTLNMSREELESLEANIANETTKARKKFECSLCSGIHVILWSFVCMPLVCIVSGAYSFYVGTITWYNVFITVSEGENVWIKIFISPLVILTYPFLILFFTLGLGCYAGLIQITYNATRWWKEVRDLEKGFYGWMCGALHLSDCSPYEVVILTDLKLIDDGNSGIRSSVERAAYESSLR